MAPGAVITGKLVPLGNERAAASTDSQPEASAAVAAAKSGA